MNNNKMRVYLAGPMRGYPRYNFDAFESAMVDLEARGITVVSPHKIDLDLGFDPNTHESQITKDHLNDWVERDVDAIISTHATVFLPNWEKSSGATAEYFVTRWLGHACYNYPDLSNCFHSSQTSNNETILEEAQRIVYGARQASYGHPSKDFTRTAKIWSAIIGTEVLPEQIPLCMMGIKISRECNAHKRDNLTDIAGYAGTLEMLHSVPQKIEC